MCEGWSLELGNAFRGAVVRQDHFEQPATWLASVNAAYPVPSHDLVVVRLGHYKGETIGAAAFRTIRAPWHWYQSRGFA